MEKMLTVYQSDKRMAYLADLLDARKLTRPLYVYAPNILVDEAETAQAANDSDIVGGKFTAEAKTLARSRGIRLFNMMENERFQAVNSRLTAEGALGALIARSPKSVRDCRVLVMGFGRMGAAVAKLFAALNVRMDIATSSVRPAHAFARRVLPLANFDFAPYDAVVNTVPLPIVPDSDLATFRNGTVYIDLASTAAINLEYARYLGVNADIYPALPAKTCPLSAAEAMAAYISEVILCKN